MFSRLQQYLMVPWLVLWKCLLGQGFIKDPLPFCIFTGYHHSFLFHVEDFFCDPDPMLSVSFSNGYPIHHFFYLMDSFACTPSKLGLECFPIHLWLVLAQP